MSNRVELASTTFTDVDGRQSYGYRMYDEYEATYCNLHEALITDDFQLLERVIHDNSESTSDLLEFASANGLYINGTWCDVDEIAHLFDKEVGAGT